MGHKLALDLPDDVFDSLTEEAGKTGQPVERLAARLVTMAVMKNLPDPLENFIGTFNSQGSDWVERHDDYLGRAALENSELNGTIRGNP